MLFLLLAVVVLVLSRFGEFSHSCSLCVCHVSHVCFAESFHIHDVLGGHFLLLLYFHLIHCVLVVFV